MKLENIMMSNLDVGNFVVISVFSFVVVQRLVSLSKSTQIHTNQAQED